MTPFDHNLTMVLFLHRQYPHWKSGRIARLLGVTAGYVRRTLDREAHGDRPVIVKRRAAPQRALPARKTADPRIASDIIAASKKVRP
jgi:hypothetical protein